MMRRKLYQSGAVAAALIASGIIAGCSQKDSVSTPSTMPSQGASPGAVPPPGSPAPSGGTLPAGVPPQGPPPGAGPASKP